MPPPAYPPVARYPGGVRGPATGIQGSIPRNPGWGPQGGNFLISRQQTNSSLVPGSQGGIPSYPRPPVLQTPPTQRPGR